LTSFKGRRFFPCLPITRKAGRKKLIKQKKIRNLRESGYFRLVERSRVISLFGSGGSCGRPCGAANSQRFASSSSFARNEFEAHIMSGSFQFFQPGAARTGILAAHLELSQCQ
jgi:hypothetical protein